MKKYVSKYSKNLLYSSGNSISIFSIFAPIFYKSIIEREFQDFKKKFKNNLEHVIKQLQQLPNITAKEISKSMNIPKSTIYNYLNELQTRKLIEVDFQKTLARGRPVKKYKLSYIS